MPHAEADGADANATEAVELVGGDQISVSVKSQQSKWARAQNADHRQAPWIVSPPSGLGNDVGWGRRSEFLKAGLLLAHIVDELDPWVGPQLRENIIIDGIVGVEDYCIAPVCIIDA